MVYSNLSPMQELLKAPGIRFKYGKFTWLGALKGAPLMLFSRVDVVPGGIKKPADIVKAKKLILLGQRPDANLDLVARPALDLFGLKYIYVPGYRGAVPRRAAMRRNEGNVTAHGLNGWRSGVEPTMGKQGIVVPLWYYPAKDGAGNYIPSPEIKKFPSILKVYREVFGKDPSGPYWDALNLAMNFRAASSNAFLAPPNTNKAAAAAFRKGFQGMMQDPDMKAALNKTTGFVMKPAKLEDVLNVFATLDQIDPKLTQFWKDYIADGGKAKKAPKSKRGGKRKKK